MDATLDVKNGSNFLISEMDPLKSLTSITFMIVCFLINVVTFIAYKRFQQTLSSVQNFDKTEQKLLVYTVITFAGHAILALYLLCVTVWTHTPKYVAIVYILYPCINDIFNLGLSSWALLWASSTFRGHFINEFYVLKSFKKAEEKNTFKTPILTLKGLCKDESEVMEPDILLLANSFYGNRLPTMFGRALLPIYSELPNWVLASYYFMTCFAYQITNIATMYMLLNRLTAIVLPLTHKKLWRKIFVPLLILMFCIPILDCCSLFQMDATLNVKNGSNFLISEMDPLKSLTSITFMIVCFLINVVTFIAYKRFQQTLSSVQNFDKTEQKLLVYTVITFAGHAILALYLLYVTVWAYDPKYITIVYILYPCINDIFNLGLSSWALLWASSTFRGHFINEFYVLKSFKKAEEKNTFKTPVIKIERPQIMLNKN
ncbi:hypothetical protein GPALN_004603 [Globodera pallida]|nr:hypothetical protein GPALN_004603 [Globodera pallida]